MTRCVGKTNGSLAARAIFAFTGLPLLVGCGASAPDVPRANTATVEVIRQQLTEGVVVDDSSSVVTAEPTGFATVRGRFTVTGDLPTPTALNITKDEAVCAPGGKTVFAQDLVVDSATGGLANVLVFAENIPAEWAHPDAAPGKADEIEFDQKECVFLTRVVAMQTSQKLRALNSDPVGHNLQVASFNQTIPSGGYAIYQPLKQQRSPVEMRCAIHPWMQAWFINRDDSYFSVSQPDGTFEIQNLPAGVEIELKVWQEKFGPVTNVVVNGESTKWSKGKVKLTLEPDSELALDVVLDASQL